MDQTCVGDCGHDQGRVMGSAQVDLGVLAAGRMAISRRLLLGSSAAAVAALTLGGCASSEPGPAGTEPTGATPSSPAGSGGAGKVLATTSEFPTGGGKIVGTAAGPVVVTEPADGQFKAFSAVCTHQGCTVAEVTENTIICKCHGSVFDAGTGEVLEGPAPKPLPAVAITVEGDRILLA